jgi:hypothetical protein
MGKEKNFLTEIERKSSKHPPGQISLDRVALYEILIALKFGHENWRPGHGIQVPDSGLEKNSLAEEALRYLIYSGRYKAKRQGSQTILKPDENKIDETVKAAIESSRIASLKPLIDIFSQFSDIISSATLLPNTSLGVVDVDRSRGTGSYSNKINGVIIEVNIPDGRLKPQVAQLVNQMEWPFGRAISVVGLRGIDINSFVSHFGGGDDLKADVLGKDVKFVDFYFGPEREMYLVFAAGGKRGLPKDFFMGTKKQVEERWLDLLKKQKNLHQQIIQTTVSKIGRGVTPEEVVFNLPYVEACFDQKERIQLVSGASFGGSLFFNQGPNEPGILINKPIISIEEGYLLHPVGIKKGNLITKVRAKIIPEGQSLTPVRQFKLS